ncbi:hypothetical protein N7U66_02535 [Lacinutrix neustonica]|uniref:Uncharacterized protein n=1 Tax=Lacinutrix neustonica TaxID=2980107 RepID=A0A9E8MX89_9FLAO|nr:hypothetical protein [Lacinutrix neustonica]WAC02590.1 hypothetical protein N7U66_02535 [Lacinutrix neustonica]
MRDKINDPKYNIILIFIFEIIGSTIAFTADYSGAGMAAIIIKWIPAIIGLLTIIIYFVSSLFIRTKNWIITLIGIILIVTVSLHINFTDFT